MKPPLEAIVYTETVVHVAAEQYAEDAPYQVAIVEWTNDANNTEERLTVRILADTETERARIGDRVSFLKIRDGVPYFRKAFAPSTE